MQKQVIQRMILKQKQIKIMIDNRKNKGEEILWIK